MTALLRFLPHVAMLAFGIALVVRAGTLERVGRLVEARRAARGGGWLAAVGSLLAAAGAGALPHARGPVAGTMLAAGFAALLAGLAGKPRPTCWAAVALLAAGVVVAIVAVR